MLFNLLYYRQYKRPIMSVNSAIVTSNDYSCCLNRIAKLQQMLELNLSSQERLVSIKQGIEKRKRQLEQIGVLQTSSVRNNLLFSPQSAINELKRTPPILQDQLLLKKSNATIQFQFLKNMTEQKQVKPRKKKNLKFEELSIQNLGANPKVINFRQIANKFGKTGLQLYKDWRDKFKVKAQKKLNSMDDARLKQKRKIYGDNWEKISYFFNGLTFEKLYYYYHENLSGVSSGKWTLRQSLMLITLIDYYGVGKWALISKKLKVKSQFQVRQRFCNVLDPTLKQNKWNDDDARLLLSIASEQKYKWSKIVKKVPRFANKTDNALRRKFRNIMIRQQDDTILKVVKNQKLAESILKFKKNYYNRSKNKKNNMNSNNVTNKKAEDEEDEDQKFKKQQEMIDEADQ